MIQIMKQVGVLKAVKSLQVYSLAIYIQSAILNESKRFEMQDFYLYSNYSYVLLCTECNVPFPPSVFDGQLVEFRMCSECQGKNPEIMDYLNKYIYEPLKNKTWRPFEERLDNITHQLEVLESDLELYKNVHSGDEDGDGSSCGGAT